MKYMTKIHGTADLCEEGSFSRTRALRSGKTPGLCCLSMLGMGFGGGAITSAELARFSIALSEIKTNQGN